MRRGRAGPAAFEVEATLEAGWGEGSGDKSDGLVEDVAFVLAGADIDTATPAGSVVEADARRGIQRGRGVLGLLRVEKGADVGVGVVAAVSGSACPVMVLAVRLGSERWRALSVSA